MIVQKWSSFLQATKIPLSLLREKQKEVLNISQN